MSYDGYFYYFDGEETNDVAYHGNQWTTPFQFQTSNYSIGNSSETTDSEGGGDPWHGATTGVLLCLVIAFTLTGNSLVVIAVASTRRLRSSVTNYFVVSLAVADLTVAVLVMPYAVLYELHGQWTFGWVFCYFWISCDVTCCTASILHLCVVAVDRYLAVTEPLTYRSRMSKRRAVIAIIGVWTCSSAISFVPIYAGWFVDDEGGSSDDETGTVRSPPMPLYEDGPVCGLHVNRIYALISSTTSFYLPLVVMLVLYAKIFRIARRQSAEIRRLEKSLMSSNQRSNLMVEGGSASPAPSGSGRAGRRRMSSDTKAVKTLGTLMGLFIVSWLPFFVVYLVKPFCSSSTWFQIPPWIESAVTWLGYCNSFINPVVYAFLNRDFRSAFRRVVLCGRVPTTSSSLTAGHHQDVEQLSVVRPTPAFSRRLSCSTRTTAVANEFLKFATKNGHDSLQRSVEQHQLQSEDRCAEDAGSIYADSNSVRLKMLSKQTTTQHQQLQVALSRTLETTAMSGKRDQETADDQNQLVTDSPIVDSCEQIDSPETRCRSHLL